MDAKRIANLIGQLAEEAIRNRITLELHEELNSALWEFSQLKGLREDVHDILQRQAEYEVQRAILALSNQ